MYSCVLSSLCYHCTILDESIQLLKNILEICPIFDISDQNNLILSTILRTTYYIVHNFFKLANFDFIGI